jgi:hypothetical protein
LYYPLPLVSYNEAMRRAGFFLLLATAHPCFAQVTRLRPSAFPELPPAIVMDLQRRGCTIPQVPDIKGRHNVIKGEFAKPGQTDWAVLCSANRASSVLIFWNGSEMNPAKIEMQDDADRLQGDANNKMVYSRAIEPVDKTYIMKHYQAYGGEKPPPIDHQGINDEFVGKASVVLYLYHGKWLHLTGAD